jgi:tRNA dimethylallyltransferase
VLAAGWVREVESLIERGLGDARVMASVGYRQIAESLKTGTAGDEAALAEAIVRATRVFARRQRTWFKKEPWWTRVIPDAALPLS